MAEERAHQYLPELLGELVCIQVFWLKFEKGTTNTFKGMVTRRKLLRFMEAK
jgi:hypothetical protein